MLLLDWGGGILGGVSFMHAFKFVVDFDTAPVAEYPHPNNTHSYMYLCIIQVRQLLKIHH